MLLASKVQESPRSVQDVAYVLLQLKNAKKQPNAHIDQVRSGCKSLSGPCSWTADRQACVGGRGLASVAAEPSKVCEKNRNKIMQVQIFIHGLPCTFRKMFRSVRNGSELVDSLCALY